MVGLTIDLTIIKGNNNLDEVYYMGYCNKKYLFLE